MESKKGSAGPCKGKQANEKGKSPKTVYKQKNYKSSPDISFGAQEKTQSLQIKAASKPSTSTNKPGNIQSGGKQNQPNVSSAGIKFQIQKTERYSLGSTAFVSPQFRPLMSTDNESKLTYVSNPAPLYQDTHNRNQNINRFFNPENTIHNKKKPQNFTISEHVNPTHSQRQLHKQEFPKTHQQGNRFMRLQRPVHPEGNRFIRPQRPFHPQGNRFPIPPAHFSQQENRFPRSQNLFQCQHLGFKDPKHEKHFKQASFQNHTKFQKSNHENKNPISVIPPAASGVNSFQQNSASFISNVANYIFTDVDNSIPKIKYKKKKADSKTVNGQQQKKIFSDKSKSRREKKRQKKVSQKKSNEIDVKNITPLFTFEKLNTEPEKNFDLIEFSDDDDFVVLSQDSVNNATAEAFDLIDFSNDNLDTLPQKPTNNLGNQDFSIIDLPVSDVDAASQYSLDNKILSLSDIDSDSSDDSEESEITSEFSVNSVKDITNSLINMKSSTTKEAFVAVFWDIENCNLSSKKSVLDFASYVRQTFYEGRSEDEFTAACDVSKLHRTVVKELEEASVTLMHISSVNKNASDKKIISCLRRFQDRYRNTNSAVVLISSDSDFTQDLHDMRYKHHIFINLICSQTTKRCLMIEANKCEFFENILQGLPDRSPNDNLQHVLIAGNLPQMKTSIIKKCLSEKLQSFNCRIKVIKDSSSAEIVFQDHSICNKANISLKGFYLGGNAISITYQERQNDIVPESKKLKDKGLNLSQSLAVNSSVGFISENSEINQESSVGKSATLSVFVSAKFGDSVYWTTTLVKTWNFSDFTIQWDKNNFLLIHFKSLKKAQKAKRILQKNQLSDENAPKFFKLIKHEDDISLKMKVINIDESNKKKIIEHVQIVEKKTQKFLKTHQDVMKKISLEANSGVHGASEAVSEKLIECNEQLETFNNYSKQTIQNIKCLNANSDKLEKELNELLCDFIRECNCISAALPIYAKKNFILQKIRKHQVIIIRAETGSGKSTQLTQYIWREKNLFTNGKIICTQPRKIAAISLAKHVSSQIGTKLGDIVGYQVNLSNKTSANTDILYVTDFTMLKMLVNEGLDNISCVIIDEAHERTIYTDILLGMIKRDLPLYPRLKIVITSATIDTSIFCHYFNLSEDAVLHIAGRTFPVEDIWLQHDVTPSWDYFSKTIDYAIDILSEGAGDVLCFLVTPLETEKAVQCFNERLKSRTDKKNVKVFNLHGKLNPQEQQKVFERTPAGVRKVIFATNCAETSITIPGIKYVVDCGMVKESQFDVAQNMNILSIKFVSKSSAEQRRGRAGRTQIGKCYHLYSKVNYNNMTHNTDPEILRISLGQALLKLMKMGIRDPSQFDFVQSPPKELLNSTMEQLLYLKAVDENTRLLTDLGNKMATLPLEPRLCHLIFQGFDNNIGYDAIALAALLTTSSNIFYRNTENKDEADKKKRRFCESENDFLTYLDVYKEWMDIPKDMKSQWCVTNCINARSMKIVQDLINELVLTLQKELFYTVKTKFETNSYDALIKAIFYTYSQNLSVFSGHLKLGYKSLNINERLLIFPGSAVSAFGQSTPQFLIYDTILKTSQTFIVNLCPVTKNIMLDAIAKYGIKIDLTALENLIATEFSISPLGEKIIINNFIGKKGIIIKDILNKVKELTGTDLVEINTDVAKGVVQIFGYGNRFEDIASIIEPIVNSGQEKLMKEERDICMLENSPFTAILTAGGILKDVILPGEFRDVKVVLKDTETMDSVTEKLRMYGPIKEIREWKKYFKVTYEFPASAEKALMSCSNEVGFSVQSIHKQLPYKDYCYKVFVTFLRRKCKGIAYIDTEPKILGPVNSIIHYKGQLCPIFKHRKTNDLCVKNLPPDTDRKDLEPIIVSSVLEPGCKITKFAVIKDKVYESSNAETDSVRENIVQLFSEFTFKEHIEVDLSQPKSKDFIWMANVYFRNPLDGEAAVNVLKSRKNISNFAGGIVLKPVLKTYLCCKPEIFSAVKDEIEKALQFFKNDLSASSMLDIKAVPKNNDKIEIKIVSNNVADLTDARRCIFTILSGDEIKFSDNLDKEKLFTQSGKEFLKKLSTSFKECHISQNIYNKTISLFGKDDVCNNVKLQINSFLKMLENEEFKDVSLKTDTGKSVLKQLLKHYEYDINGLKEECNLSDIQMNKYKQILTVQGDLASVSKCEGIIKEVKDSLDLSDAESIEEMCPVCYDEVSEEKHRLEYCGHAYCKECLLHLFQNSDIPLSCELNSENGACGAPVVLADIFWALNGRKPLEKIMFDKFLRTFVDSKDDINNCPSPDCCMVFRVTDKMNVFRCPACGNDICTRCKEFFHSGLSCSVYQCLKSKTETSLLAFMKEDPLNRKCCPSCSSPIEKNGGCNHMTCWKCKCHMCWLCLKVFPDGPSVYNHQLLCPNG